MNTSIIRMIYSNAPTRRLKIMVTKRASYSHRSIKRVTGPLGTVGVFVTRRGNVVQRKHRGLITLNRRREISRVPSCPPRPGASYPFSNFTRLLGSTENFRGIELEGTQWDTGHLLTSSQ